MRDDTGVYAGFRIPMEYDPLISKLVVWGAEAGFVLGTLAWFYARTQKKGVADLWIYRFSRHPQYLGWIIWSYGLMFLPNQSNIKLNYELKKAAAHRLKDLIGMTRSSDDAEMIQWGRMLKRWSRYLLNFFDNRTTNAYTEGIHTKIKMIKRVSFGFRNVQIYVRKVLLCIFPWALLLSLRHFSS